MSEARGSSVLRWAEIAIRCDRERYTGLSELLREKGIENEVEFIETTPDDFAAVCEDAKTRFDQIRVGGALAEPAATLTDRLPSALLTLRSADALVYLDGEWWPRNFLIEGLQRSIASDLAHLDFLGGVFILGATAEARAVVAALSRVGFTRFNISESDATRGQEFVEQMRKTYFQTQCQFVPRHMITQLPGVHSVGVSTIREVEDDGLLTELSYFNFLRSGGIWLDLPFVPLSSSLENEARNVGALVEPSYRVWARADQFWLESCVPGGAAISVEAVIEKYKQISMGSIG